MALVVPEPKEVLPEKPCNGEAHQPDHPLIQHHIMDSILTPLIVVLALGVGLVARRLS